MTFELNVEQKSAVLALREFLESDSKFYGLFGYAGTGKTTVIQHVFEDTLLEVAMTAPTHKAVGVLASMAREQGLSGIHFATIHSLCAVRKVYEDGKIKFRPKPDAPQPIREFDVVIIDECSMVSESMWGWITDAIIGTHVKIIVMGDDGQLPPVGETESPTFELPHSRLNRVMRNAGAVQAAGTNARLNIMSRTPVLPNDAEDEHGEIRNLEPDDWLDLLLENSDTTSKALAFTNASVDWINDWVRTKKFGKDAAPYMPGERLVLIDSYEVSAKVTLHTETELEVVAAKKSVKKEIHCWRLTAKDNIATHTLYALDDTQRPAYETHLAIAKAKGRALGKSAWREYYELLEAFAKLRPGWATTIHKSQGSTYDNVFLVQTDVLRGARRDHAFRNMLLYVGYSRARKGLYLS